MKRSVQVKNRDVNQNLRLFRQEAEEFVKDLLAAVGDGSAAKMRGPLLAAVDLEARILSRAERVSSGQSAGPSGQPGRSTDTPELAAAVLHYFKCVGHLASCAADLRYFFAIKSRFSVH